MTDEIIVFNNERIDIVSHIDHSDSDEEYSSDIDDQLEINQSYVTDIYSNEHRWDTHVSPSYRFRPDIWWCQVERFFSNE